MSRVLHRGVLLLLLGFAVFFVAGCRKKQVQAAPLPAPTVTSRAPEEVSPPDIDAQPETKPPELVIPPATRPPRPRRPSSAQPAAPELAPEPESAEIKPAAPRMAPRLTPAEEDSYREKTWQAIGAAEKNLLSARGRTLKPAQLDLEGKVRGFLAQAREAIGVGDWVRALNLADKALVLSRELVSSL